MPVFHWQYTVNKSGLDFLVMSGIIILNDLNLIFTCFSCSKVQSQYRKSPQNPRHSPDRTWEDLKDLQNAEDPYSMLSEGGQNNGRQRAI